MTDEQMQPVEEATEELEEVSESSTEETTPEGEAQTPESGAEHEKAEQEAGEDKLPPEVQEKINARINQITREKWEERRKREALEQEFQKLQSEMQPKEPEVPELPDPYEVTEDEFRAAVRERDEALRKRAAYDADQRAAEQQRLQQEENAVRQQQQRIIDSVKGCLSRAEQLGVPEQDLAVAAQTVRAYGVSPDVSDYILNDERGPLILTHLAGHPEEISYLASVHPTQAAVHIATKIAPNLQAKPKQTKAPPPPDTLDGGGAPPAQDGPEGASYE